MATRMRGNPKGDVQWTLPGRKRPFAHSTTATSDLIVALSQDGLTVSEARDAINYDPEAVAILSTFVDAGHGDARLDSLVA